MKRLWHCLFNFVVAVSLLLCIGLVALWVRSYLATDELVVYRARRYSIASEAGVLRVRICNCATEAATDSGPTYFPVPYSETWRIAIIRRLVPAAGDDIDCHFDDDEYRYRPTLEERREVARLPIWLLAGVTTLLPIRWGTRFREDTRRMSNRCIMCGYDLRATPDRCPECGAEVKTN